MMTKPVSVVSIRRRNFSLAGLQNLQGPFALGDEARLLNVLVGDGGELLGQSEEHARNVGEALIRHGRHVPKGVERLVLVDTDLTRIAQDLLLALCLVTHLPDQPTGDVASADSDGRAGIPETTAQTRLNDRAGQGVTSDGDIRAATIRQPFGTLANEITEPAETARAR